MSFLEKEEEAKPSSFWDWVVGLGLLLLVGGFTFIYQYQKRSSLSRFHRADSLFVAGSYPQAGALYDELKSAQYGSTHDDSIIFARLDTIETATEKEATRLREIQSRLDAHDTLTAMALLGQIRYKELLTPEEQAFVDSLRLHARGASAP